MSVKARDKRKFDEDDAEDSSPDSTGIVEVPAESEMPEEGDSPPEERAVKLNNLADDKELADAVWTWATARHSAFDTQDQRREWIGDSADQSANASHLDFADRAWRVAERRDTASDQYQNTLSNVASGVYYEAVRTNHAALKTIFFGSGNDLPAEYEPEINTDEYTPSQGEEIASHQNALAQFTWDEDKRVSHVDDALMFCMKNANDVCCIEWDECEREVVERVPDVTKGLDEQGMPLGYKRKTVKRMVRSWPTFRRIDLKDIWFDCMIDGFDKQRVFLWREQWGLEDIMAEREAGRFKNTEKITTEMLYYEDSDTMRQRQVNAGEQETTGENGLFCLWHIKGWMPIREFKGRRAGRGKWDKTTVPSYYWATFASRSPGSPSVCLRLEKDPYWTIGGKSNFLMLHAEKDDKGAFHDGNPTRLKSIYWQIVTNENQGCDNVTKIVNAPHVADGPVKKRNLTYRQNDLIKVGKGTKFEVLAVPDVTQSIGNNRDYFQRQAMKISATDKPLTAEPLGARTSSAEAKNVYDMAMMPMDAMAEYIGNQLFSWMFEWDAILWRHFCDPEIKRAISYGGKTIDVFPSRLWGPIKTKITAVSRFHNNTVRRQELNLMLQNIFPLAEKYMGPKGAPECLIEFFEAFGMKNAREWFPAGGDYDAEKLARMLVMQIAMTGQWDEPTPEENHRVYIRILEAAMRDWAFVDEGALAAQGITPEEKKRRLDMFRQQIDIRQRFMAQEQEQGPPQQQGPPGGTPPELGAEPMSGLPEGAMEMAGGGQPAPQEGAV